MRNYYPKMCNSANALLKVFTAIEGTYIFLFANSVACVVSCGGR